VAAHDPNPLEPTSPTPVPAPRLYGGEPRRGMALVAPPVPPPALATPDALSLLKALRRRWLLALSLGVLLAGLAGAAGYLLLPARYTAFFLLQVASRTPGFIDRPEGRTEFSTLMNTVAGRIKSRDVLMRTLSQDQVRHLRLIRKYPDTLSALTWMEEYLKVDYSVGSELLTVALTGEDSNDLVVIVSEMVKSYLKIINDEEKVQRKARLEKVQLLYERAREKLNEKMAQKEDLLQKQGAKDTHTMQQRQALLQGQLQRAQDMEIQFRFELEKKMAQLAHLRASKEGLAKAPDPEGVVREIQDADPDLKQLQANLQRYENANDRLRAAGHGPNDPLRRRYETMAAEMRGQVEARLAKVKAEAAGKGRQKRAEGIEQSITSLNTEIAPLEGHVRKWQEKVETLTKDLETVRFTNAKHDSLDTEIVQEEKNVAQLFDAYKRAQLEEEAEPRVTPRGEAELQTRDTKKRLFLLALIPLGAFAGTVLAVAWWEFMGRRIHGPDEVTTSLALRLVGEIPELPDPRRRRLGDGQAEELYRHNLIESVDAIRTMLLRNAGPENLRVLMVTSAVGGEGKTTLASNLAMSLARAGRKTLLLDCDLRRPAAHQLFEQTLQPGFSEVVLQEVELPDAVRPTTTDDNLFLLPAGHWDREVIQELAKSGVNGLFEKLREEFDFVIVDSHPVLPATDSLLLGQHADAVIMSLMRDVSQTHLVQSACGQLATLGIRVFGAVVNGVPVKVYGKQYQYQQQPANAA